MSEPIRSEPRLLRRRRGKAEESSAGESQEHVDSGDGFNSELKATIDGDSESGQALVRAAPAQDDRKIGEILVDGGLMKPRDVRRVLRRQKSEGDPFGRLARQLGLVSQSDVKWALSMQRSVVAPAANMVPRPRTRELWCLNRQDTSGSEAIRTLRSQLMLRSAEQEPKPIAILSPARREGRSFIASNLATAFAQAGRRTLLVDADLRSPRQHRIFGLPNDAGFSSLLNGDHDAHPVFNVIDDLYVVPAGPVTSSPQELLCREYTGQWLDVAMRYFDVVLIDTPAASEYADAELIAAWAGRSLIIVKKNSTKSRDLDNLAKRITDNKSEIAGFVMNAA